MERYNCTRDSWISTMHVTTNFKMKVALLKTSKFLGSTASTLLVQLLQPLQRRKEKELQRTQNDTGSQTQANVRDVFPHKLK